MSLFSNVCVCVGAWDTPWIGDEEPLALPSDGNQLLGDGVKNHKLLEYF